PHRAAQVLFARLRESQVLELHVAEIAERRRVVRLQAHCLLQRGRGGLMSAALELEGAQVEPGLREVRAVAQGQTKAVGGVLAPAQPLTGNPEIKMSIGVVAAQLDAALEMPFRLLVAACVKRRDTRFENGTV